MISSTALDLPEHREQAVNACLSEEVFPIGMEHLPACPTTRPMTKSSSGRMTWPTPS
jgi:hypothetical protein